MRDRRHRPALSQAARIAWLGLSLPAVVQAATCREWTCTDPLFRISPSEQSVSTDFPATVVGAGPIFTVNGTATNATSNGTLLSTVPEASADCVASDLADPIDCLCGCTTPGRVPVLVLPGLVVVYAFIVAFFVVLIKWLRAGPKREYTQLRRSQGLSEEQLNDPNEPPAMSTLAWMSKPNNDVLQDYGLDAAVYLLHCRQCSMYWMGQFVVVGVALCYVYRVRGDFEHNWNMFAFSYANLAPSNSLKWVPALAQFWFAGSTVWFAKHKQKAMDTYKRQAESEDMGGRHTSLNTVWIQGVASSATEHDLVRWFDRNYKGQVEQDEHGVIRAKLVWDVNALGHNVRLRRKWIKQINALSRKKPQLVPKQQAKADKDITRLIEKVDTLSEWEKPLRQRGKRAAGSAFVTFSEEEHCLNFRRAMVHHRAAEDTAEAVALGVSRWSTELAPRPADIYWENFGLDPNEEVANHAKVTFWTLVMFTLFVMFGLAIMWTIGFLYFELLYRVYPKESIYASHRSQYDFVGPYVWYGGGAVCAVIFLALEEEMSPIVKFLCKFDSPLTKSHKQSSYLHKIFWFYVIYHVLLTTFLFGRLVLWLEVADVAVVGVEGVEKRSGRLQLYVETVGAFHQNRLFLTSCVIDMLHVMEGVGFFTRKARQLTAEEEGSFQGAEDAEDEEDDLHISEGNHFLNCKFDYTRNYGESIAVMTSISCYATMHPTIMFFGAFYFAIKSFVDKYQITNQYSRPHVQYGRRARTTTIAILYSQTVAQYLNSVYFLVLADDMADVGLVCLGSAVGFTALISTYVYQPESLKVFKSGSRHVKTTKLNMNASADGTAAAAAAAGGGAAGADSSAPSSQSGGRQGGWGTSVGMIMSAGGMKAEKNLDLIRNIYSPPEPDSIQVGLRMRLNPQNDNGRGGQGRMHKAPTPPAAVAAPRPHGAAAAAGHHGGGGMISNPTAAALEAAAPAAAAAGGGGPPGISSYSAAAAAAPMAPPRPQQAGQWPGQGQGQGHVQWVLGNDSGNTNANANGNGGPPAFAGAPNANAFNARVGAAGPRSDTV
jgi:hypothetical protein